jgi:LysR family transcriptional activator of nhaA
MANYFLYDKIIPLFKAEDIKVNIQQEERHLLLAELEEGNLDIVITDSKDSLGNQMSAHRIGVNKTFVVAHKKFAKFKKDFPDCLNHIPFFNYTKDSELKYEIELFFAKNRLAPKEIGEGDDSELFDLITAKGLAFTIVPEVAKNRMCKDKNIIALGEVEELETYVWGIMKSSYKGHAYKLIKEGV